jgi:hypothetical protein
MRMPGFTADISLYQANAHYPMVWAFNQTSGVVHLARIIDPLTCTNQCRRDCQSIQDFYERRACIAGCDDYCYPRCGICTCIQGIQSCTQQGQSFTRSCLP